MQRDDALQHPEEAAAEAPQNDLEEVLIDGSFAIESVNRLADFIPPPGSDEVSGTRSSTVVEAMSRPCPSASCQQRISHFHGHFSSHSVQQGCPSCKLKFCFVCSCTEEENVRVRGTENACKCGRWTMGCKPLENVYDAQSYLTLDPYPRDSRCGCALCNICRPGLPCADCDGKCVVCSGVYAYFLYTGSCNSSPSRARREFALQSPSASPSRAPSLLSSVSSPSLSHANKNGNEIRSTATGSSIDSFLSTAAQPAVVSTRASNKVPLSDSKQREGSQLSRSPERLDLLHALFFAACRDGNEEDVADMLKGGRVRVDRQEAVTRKTALHVSLENGHVNVARLLIDSLALLNVQDAGDGTALLRVCDDDTVERVIEAELLLAHGADVCTSDHRGRSPLHCACERGYLSLVRLLVDHGAAIDIQDANGMLPIQLAQNRKFPDIVQFLDNDEIGEAATQSEEDALVNDASSDTEGKGNDDDNGDDDGSEASPSDSFEAKRAVLERIRALQAEEARARNAKAVKAKFFMQLTGIFLAIVFWYGRRLLLSQPSDGEFASPSPTPSSSDSFRRANLKHLTEDLEEIKARAFDGSEGKTGNDGYFTMPLLEQIHSSAVVLGLASPPISSDSPSAHRITAGLNSGTGTSKNANTVVDDTSKGMGSSRPSFLSFAGMGGVDTKKSENGRETSGLGTQGEHTDTMRSLGALVSHVAQQKRRVEDSVKDRLSRMRDGAAKVVSQAHALANGALNSAQLAGKAKELWTKLSTSRRSVKA